jgi:tetratricopeptide (TPR) repeat protein
VKDDQKKKDTRPVNRAQYDQLLTKYEELSKKYEALKENPKEQNSLVDELTKSNTENFAPSSETVDPGVVAAAAAPIVVPNDIDSQLELFKKGVALRSTQAGEATKIFQQLESQATPAIRVRAKFEIAQMLFERNQFDLSLQIFEDIISKNAQSGVVLESLEYAVKCSEKLGIQNKKDQYASMLNDVFEAK